MLKNKNHSVTFFPSTKWLGGNPYWSILSRGLVENGINYYKNKYDSFTTRWLILQRKKISLIHIHYCQTFYKDGNKANLLKILCFALNLGLAHLLGYKIIFTLHNSKPTYPLKPIWMDRLGHFIAIHLSNRIIVHCNEGRRLVNVKFLRKRQVYLVDHPNLIGEYPNLISKEQARTKLNIPQSAIIFGYLGGIRPNKGIELLIDAFQQIKTKDVRLLIAGEKNRPAGYAERLQELSRFDKRIILKLGHIANNDLQVFLKSADIFVFPFRWILTSSSVILAMSFSKPVIVPKMGCLPELVNSDSGWFFEEGNVDSLSGKMIEALKSDFKIMGLNASDTIVDNTIEKFIKQTITAYWG